mgnify:CR=1 FL=1
MTNLIGSTKRETVRKCISFAQSNNYNVSKEYNQLKKESLSIMIDIHSNGKQGDYERVILLKTAIETLSDWA